MSTRTHRLRPETLIRWVSCVALLALLGTCTSTGPQRYRSYFQALELARAGQTETSLEAFRAACADNSSAACHRIGKNVDPALPIPILQGATSESETEILLLVPAGQPALVLLWDLKAQKLVEPHTVLSQEMPGNRGKMVTQQYEDLTKVGYLLQVVGSSGELLDGRDLSVLDLSKRNGTFAVASCMGDRHPLQKGMWADLVNAGPEMIFLIGDNVYADSDAVVPKQPVPVDVLWRRYIETRERLEIFKTRKLIPIFAVWDDHDYGQNDGDETYPFKVESKKIFQTFFGAVDYPGVVDRGPGVSTRINAWGQRFVLLDNRSFRSPASQKNTGTHFGVDQESWLFTESLGDSPVVLFDGDQFFGGYHPFESFEGRHPASFERFLHRVKSLSAPVLFISGDRHLAELMEIPADVLGYRTYELTTSSIHANVYPDAFEKNPSPRQIDGVAGVNNYAIVETDASNGWTVHVRTFGPDKRKLFSRSLEIHK